MSIWFRIRTDQRRMYNLHYSTELTVLAKSCSVKFTEEAIWFQNQRLTKHVSEQAEYFSTWKDYTPRVGRSEANINNPWHNVVRQIGGCSCEISSVQSCDSCVSSLLFGTWFRTYSLRLDEICKLDHNTRLSVFLCCELNPEIQRPSH